MKILIWSWRLWSFSEYQLGLIVLIFMFLILVTLLDIYHQAQDITDWEEKIRVSLISIIPGYTTGIVIILIITSTHIVPF